MPLYLAGWFLISEVPLYALRGNQGGGGFEGVDAATLGEWQVGSSRRVLPWGLCEDPTCQLFVRSGVCVVGGTKICNGVPHDLTSV